MSEEDFSDWARAFCMNGCYPFSLTKGRKTAFRLPAVHMKMGLMSHDDDCAESEGEADYWWDYYSRETFL